MNLIRNPKSLPVLVAASADGRTRRGEATAAGESSMLAKTFGVRSLSRNFRYSVSARSLPVLVAVSADGRTRRGEATVVGWWRFQRAKAK